MATYTWNTAVTSGNWNVNGNWTTAGFPGGGTPDRDVAVLPADLGHLYTVTLPATTIDLLQLTIAGSSGTGHGTDLNVDGILNMDTLDYTGAHDAARIDIAVGGRVDIRDLLESGNTQTLTIGATGTGGYGTGGRLQLGSATSSGFAISNSNVTFRFDNNATGINSGVVEFVSGFVNGGTVTGAQEISNLAWGDEFVVDGANLTGAHFAINSGTLTATAGTSVINFTSLTLGALTAADFVGAGDAIEIVCYARGTRILTSTGEVAVENLAAGDLIITATGGSHPIRWLGHRRVNLAGHLRPEAVAPVRIARDAFADGAPHRDLVVSPDHAIFVDGKLICARQLVNGTTVCQELDWTAVDYYHVELDQHAILLAEGLPAESYIDTGNSGFFANSDAPLVLHPDLTDQSGYPTREAGSCAPFVWDEASVRPVWQRLAQRAATIGKPVPERETTVDPGLRLIAKGRAVKPVFSDDRLVIFSLPRGAREVRLVSRAQPATVARPWLEDRRRLGVRVGRIVLRGVTQVLEVPVDHPDIAKGWWAVERDGQAMARWTDGDATLPLPAIDGNGLLEIHLAGTMPYVIEVAEESLARRSAA